MLNQTLKNKQSVVILYVRESRVEVIGSPRPSRSIPVELTALPDPDYVFSGWSDAALENTPTAITDFDRAYSVTANFEQKAPSDIVINEINYNSHKLFNPGDWIEFHNVGDAPIDISGWHFKDGNDTHDFTFPNATVIDANGYLVLCQNSTAFRTSFPQVDNHIGNLDFGLSNAGELIRLYDRSGLLVDSLTYDDRPPWPIEADGTGSTMALTDPFTDNENPKNWAISSNRGSPGSANNIKDTTDSPVDYSSFEISSGKAGIYLAWTTASEHQNQGFKVYRSINQSAFSLIASYETDPGRLQGQSTREAETHYVWLDEAVEIGSKYSYLLSSVSSRTGEEKHYDQARTLELLDPEDIAVEDNFIQNYPNPFNFSTNISFKLAEKSVVFLAIYNIKGERVKTFIDHIDVGQGEHFLEWDGRDDFGRPVSSGVYFYQIKSRGFKQARKMVFLK